jgi:hypothetical protein
MKRRALVFVFCLATLLGLGSVAFVMHSSLQPSAASDARLPRVPTTDIAPGTYRFIPDLLEDHRFRGEILFLRNAGGQLAAWYIPGRNGVRSMPDGHWWRPGVPCPNLRPDFAAGVIACFDPDASAWVRSHFRWSLEGKAQSDHLPDMEPMPGVEESGFFVFFKRHAA